CRNQCSPLSNVHSEPDGFFSPFSDVSHCASRTFTTNQPSPAGARPEPRSSSGASGMDASLVSSAVPEIVELFLELAAIPSPPGAERVVTDVATRYLHDLGPSSDENGFGHVSARIEPGAQG